MFVINRKGEKEEIDYNRIRDRIKSLSEGLEGVNHIEISKKTIQGLYNGIKASELDILAAETSAYMISEHEDYGVLASRLVISNLHRETEESFYKTCEKLYHKELITDELLKIAKKYQKEINEVINYERDYNYDYFGFKTLSKKYLIDIDGKIVERPQHMLMRVSLGIWGENLAEAFNMYNQMSEMKMTHASPTLFHSGTPCGQLSSCFLIAMDSDSIDGIYKTLGDCARISKGAGGIGLHVHKIRASGTKIKGTNGTSNGLVPMLRVYNNTARYVDQGGGKRKGAFAIYLEPWHADIEEFLELKHPHGKEEMRARDLFYALWVPDLFMQRVEKGEKWSLMCPKKQEDLSNYWGDEFRAKYEKLEQERNFVRQIPARELWNKIVISQIETGGPFMLYKDQCNRCSNHNHLGTIKSSNLCTEIIQYSSPTETAVCNLASIALPKFVSDDEFDFDKFEKVVRQTVRNLNQVIDRNRYPTKETANSNMKHRPIGIGIQGLADVFLLLKMPFTSDEARKLNREIFEALYYFALSESNVLAMEKDFSVIEGSMASKGILHFDHFENVKFSGRHDWHSLKRKIQRKGLVNSLLIAPMPTATTSQILGNNECFEPYTSNIYQRRVLSGTFTVINKHLIRDLREMNLWNSEMKNKIILNKGSVQEIPEIPIKMKQLYKTVWEISQKSLLEMAKERLWFVDQSMSLTVFMANPTFAKLNSMHFYGWKLGLKTGMYYLRTKAAREAIQFTVEKESNDNDVCDINDPNCESCGS